MVGLASALGRSGHQVTVLTYRDGNFYDEVLTKNSVAHISLHSDRTPAIVSELSKYITSSGTEVLVSYLTGANIKACYVKRNCPRLKLIVSERSFNLHLYPHDIYRFLLFRKWADRVVCNNYSQEEFIRNICPILSGRLLTIPNFVDLQSFNVPAHKTCSSIQLDSRTSAGVMPDKAESVKRIIVTARVCRRKNTDGLIKAAYELAKSRRDFRIDWYGKEGDNAYSRKCDKLIRKLSIDDLFTIHNAMNDVGEVYGSSDIFCLPSFFEGTSNSLAEALASGLPAVCSRVGDNSRYISEGRNGYLFDPYKPKDIARSIGLMLDADLKKFGEEGRKVAEENLSMVKFKESYNSLINGRKRIAALTMVRHGMPFLAKWIEYYGSQLGRDNIFVFLDGEDQYVPDYCREACVMTTIPHMGLSVVNGDRARACFLSERAAELFKKGYDLVIGTDVDEFILPDPACGKGLAEFLSETRVETSISPLGVDIIQKVGEENAIDPSLGYLQQRHYAWLCPRYTKTSIIAGPFDWGAGFHRVKHKNYHICKDLFLFHLGYCDNQSVLDKVVSPETGKNGWRRHINRRLFVIRKCNKVKPVDFDKSTRSARSVQTIFRHLFAWNKPSMLGHQVIVRIPERFKDII